MGYNNGGGAGGNGGNPQDADDFDGIEQVSSGVRLPRLDESRGEYVLQVISTHKYDGRGNQTWFVNEFKVVEAIGPKAYAPGSLTSYRLNKAWDTTISNIKPLIATLIRQPESAVTKKDAQELYDGSNPARDTLIRVIVYDAPKKSGGVWGKMKFSPYIGASLGAASMTASITPVPETGATSATSEAK